MDYTERYRASNAERNAKVLAAAVVVAEREGYQFITRELVAKEAGVSVGTVNVAFGTMLQLKRAVLAEAIRVENLAIVAEGLANKSPVVDGIDPHLKQRALASIV